jgi:hypothetical protein
MAIEELISVGFFWFLGWAGLILFLNKRNDYIKNYKLVSLYFIIISFLALYYFRDIIYPIYKQINIFILIFLFVLILPNLNFYDFIKKRFKKPLQFFEKYSKLPFLHLDKRYLVSKSLEILYQQILIVILVFILKDLSINIFMITFVFAVLFGFGHLAALVLYKSFFGKLVFIASIFASLIFPYLILNFRYGFVGTYLLHLYFYTSSGILFWAIDNILQNKIPKN